MKWMSEFVPRYAVSILSMFIAVAVAVPATATINDDFDAAPLSPFWTFTGPGTISFASDVVHSGSHSVMLQASTSYPWSSTLQHDFGRQYVVGSVSVWMQGQKMCCQSAAGLQIADSEGNWAVIQQAGNGKTPDKFTARVSGSPAESDYAFTANPNEWHLVEINTAPNGVTLKFDGKVVLTSPRLTKFETVQLTVWGGPGGSAYFDGFTASICECVTLSAQTTSNAIR